MSDRLIDLLLRLSARERVLLALLGAVLLPAALWLGVVSPLQERHQAAQSSLAQAQALGDWVVARAGEYDQIAQTVSGAAGLGPQPPIGISGLEQSLVQVGLREATAALAGQADGRIELRFDVVAFTRLADWLSASDPGWGYDIEAFWLERLETPGMVSADLTLRPQN